MDDQVQSSTRPLDSLGFPRQHCAAKGWEDASPMLKDYREWVKEEYLSNVENPSEQLITDVCWPSARPWLRERLQGYLAACLISAVKPMLAAFAAPVWHVTLLKSLFASGGGINLFTPFARMYRDCLELNSCFQEDMESHVAGFYREQSGLPVYIPSMWQEFRVDGARIVEGYRRELNRQGELWKRLVIPPPTLKDELHGKLRKMLDDHVRLGTKVSLDGLGVLDGTAP